MPRPHIHSKCTWPQLDSRKYDQQVLFLASSFGDDFNLDTYYCEEAFLSDQPQQYPWTLVPCPEECPDCGESGVHRDCIIIAVESVQEIDVDDIQRSAIGIYFGQASPLNIGGITVLDQFGPVDYSCPTSTVAELEACGHALDEVVRIKWTKIKEDLCQVVIKTTSEYLYLAMTEWLPDRIYSGHKCIRDWTLSNKSHVSKKPLWLLTSIERAIACLEDLGVEVLFWYVKKEDYHTRMARRLASAALGDDMAPPIRDLPEQWENSSDSMDPLQLSPVALEPMELREKLQSSKKNARVSGLEGSRSRLG